MPNLVKHDDVRSVRNAKARHRRLRATQASMGICLALVAAQQYKQDYEKYIEGGNEFSN